MALRVAQAFLPVSAYTPPGTLRFEGQRPTRSGRLLAPVTSPAQAFGEFAYLTRNLLRSG
jgi:hypothetical protein